ncbi:unnamed protein product [Ixodes hexagonus]
MWMGAYVKFESGGAKGHSTAKHFILTAVVRFTAPHRCACAKLQWSASASSKTLGASRLARCTRKFAEIGYRYRK